MKRFNGRLVPMHERAGSASRKRRKAKQVAATYRKEQQQASVETASRILEQFKAPRRRRREDTHG